MAAIRKKKRVAGRMGWLLLVVVGVLSLWLFVFNSFWSSDVRQLKKTVQQFYSYEQTGDYGSAWELFHPQMKDIYTKDYYIQLRAHIFMQQLNATQTRLTLGKPEKLGEWQLSEGAQPLSHVYRLSAEQRFLSSFGLLTMRQDVFAVKEADSWLLLWSFRE